MCISVSSEPSPGDMTSCGPFVWGNGGAIRPHEGLYVYIKLSLFYHASPLTYCQRAVYNSHLKIWKPLFRRMELCQSGSLRFMTMSEPQLIKSMIEICLIVWTNYSRFFFNCVHEWVFLHGICFTFLYFVKNVYFYTWPKKSASNGFWKLMNCKERKNENTHEMC